MQKNRSASILFAAAALLCTASPLLAKDADPGFLKPSEMYDPARRCQK